MQEVINVAKMIGSPSALTREQGGLIFDAIVPKLKDGKIVTLDFGDVESIITPFLNERLRIVNYPDGTVNKLQIVIDNAKTYYSNRNKFEETVKEVIYKS